MEAYGDVEKTGSATQFYDKFKFRMFMSSTFHYMLKDAWYKNQMNELALEDQPRFLKFIHFLMQEINTQFEEAIESVKKMKQLEEEE